MFFKFDTSSVLFIWIQLNLSVNLRGLTGACGTCPSSTTTMKMGIERRLKEKFGDAIKDICQVYDEQINETTVEVSL